MNAAGELTLYDMLLALGERHSQVDYSTGADNRAVVRADPATRDRLLRAINNGRREVYSRMPDARCFQPRITITMDPDGAAANVVDADPSKYALPFAVHGLAGGQWTWRLPGTAGYGGPLTQAHQSDLAGMHYTRNAAALTGRPVSMAFCLKSNDNPSEPGRRTSSFLWVYPAPNLAYILEGQARVMYAPLVAMDDMEPMGQEHLETILAFASRDWKLASATPEERVELEARCDKAIAISTELDNARGPQTIGPGHDPDAERESRRYRNGRYYPEIAAMVDTVSGTPVL